MFGVNWNDGGGDDEDDDDDVICCLVHVFRSLTLFLTVIYKPFFSNNQVRTIVNLIWEIVVISIRPSSVIVPIFC